MLLDLGAYNLIQAEDQKLSLSENRRMKVEGRLENLAARETLVHFQVSTTPRIFAHGRLGVALVPARTTSR